MATANRRKAASPRLGEGKSVEARRLTGHEFAILFRAEARPGKEKELLEFLRNNSEACKKEEPGTLRFDVLQDPSAPRAFYVYEVYKNAAAFEEHKNNRPFRRWKSDEFQTQVLADCCGFRKLAEGVPLALMARDPDRR